MMKLDCNILQAKPGFLFEQALKTDYCLKISLIIFFPLGQARVCKNSRFLKSAGKQGIVRSVISEVTSYGNQERMGINILHI